MMPSYRGYTLGLRFAVHALQDYIQDQARVMHAAATVEMDDQRISQPQRSPITMIKQQQLTIHT
ncbi:hypothetical protein J6590_046605 [Homalodisca vitripennis]|nr:hypothetical protein J6590_046605 [Homalodisca vitripennis]